MSFFLFLADVSVPTHVFFLCGKKGIAVIRILWKLDKCSYSPMLGLRDWKIGDSAVT
jgi:hypothetical protein